MRGRAVVAAQAAYYVAGGLWPLVSMPTFLAVTGRKRELWLVRNVSALMVLIGAVLAVGERRGNRGREMTLLGAGSCAVFGGVDVWYAAVRRRIAPTYLLDGLAQLALGIAWFRASREATRCGRRDSRPGSDVSELL